MAKEVGTNRIEREAGDACPRQGCAGTLGGEVVGMYKGEEMVQCSGCARLFPRRYSIPLNELNRQGYEAHVVIPDPVVFSVAQAMWQKEHEAAVLNPGDRHGWADLTDSERSHWTQQARLALIPIWPQLGEWFEAYMFTVEKGRAAMNALTEIAIPSLKYCEKRYGHDDQARVNIEAAITK